VSQPLPVSRRRSTSRTPLIWCASDTPAGSW
jgi:hypothetical protein